MKSMSEVACDLSNSRSKFVRFYLNLFKLMDFLCNMNILGISRNGVEGWGRGGCVMLTMSIYLRWIDVGDISEKVFNEGDDILVHTYFDT